MLQYITSILLAYWS